MIKTINTLLRSRFNNAQEYLDNISGFNLNDIDLLSKLVNLKNQNGENLSEKQKINFIGDIDSDEIYMDVYGGSIKKDSETKRIPKCRVYLLKLK